MSKAKVTRKSLSTYPVITVGYCDLQHLLTTREPDSYCAGINGWDCDNYHVNSFVISTGYRPIKGIHADYEVCKKYDSQAKQLYHSISDYAELSKELDNLLSDFISEVTK